MSRRDRKPMSQIETLSSESKIQHLGPHLIAEFRAEMRVFTVLANLEACLPHIGGSRGTTRQQTLTDIQHLRLCLDSAVAPVDYQLLV